MIKGLKFTHAGPVPVLHLTIGFLHTYNCVSLEKMVPPTFSPRMSDPLLVPTMLRLVQWAIYPQL